MAIGLFAGQTFVESDIEQTEMSAGVCISIDPECSSPQKAQIQLGDLPSSELHLLHHLLADLHRVDFEAGFRIFLMQELFAIENTLLFRIFPSSVFHPPKA